MTAGVSGGGSDASLRVSSVVTFTIGSAAAASRLSRTDSTEVRGKMRQLTLATARWGRALVAWPPLSMVAMRVVRRMAFIDGSDAAICRASATFDGSLANAPSARPASPPTIGAMALKKPTVVSLVTIGNS